jgi:integrase
MPKKRSGNPLNYQITTALKKINNIGYSKKRFKEKKIDTGIHSIAQMNQSLSCCHNFGKWCKEIGLKDLYHLKKQHYVNYINYMERKGSSMGHLINIETNLKLLAKGMNKVSNEKGFKGRNWTLKQRIIEKRRREKPKDRSYSEEQIIELRSKVSKSGKIGLDLQMAFGLRLREAVLTRVAHIVERDARIYWIAVKNKNEINTSHGVTKGGRPREILCRPEYENLVRELIENRKKDEFICPIKYDSLKGAYTRAAARTGIPFTGSHGFRHTFARNCLADLLNNFGIYEAGKEIIAKMLTNREKKQRKDKGISSSDRHLYILVNNCVDQVHAWLGHGKGRIDLCEVYMK